MQHVMEQRNLQEAYFFIKRLFKFAFLRAKAIFLGKVKFKLTCVSVWYAIFLVLSLYELW